MTERDYLEYKRDTIAHWRKAVEELDQNKLATEAFRAISESHLATPP